MPSLSRTPFTNEIDRESSPRILIVRLSAMGDVIHGIPVACALRAAFPNAFLAWIVEGTAGDVLEGHPAIDELVRVPRRYWKSPREVLRMRSRLCAKVRRCYRLAMPYEKCDHSLAERAHRGGSALLERTAVNSAACSTTIWWKRTGCM